MMYLSPIRKFIVAGLALLTVPATVLAQSKAETKKEDKEVKEVQHITITRTGDINEKTVVEIQGNTVKVNGKEGQTNSNNNVSVRVNTTKGVRHPNVIAGRPGTHAFTFENLHPTIYGLDSNRAMLGVVTEGKNNGAAIVSVGKESAAEKAGLKKGDVITRIGNKKIETTDDVSEAIREQKPGNKIDITFLRDGKEQKATAELGRWRGINATALTAPRILDSEIWRERMEENLNRIRVPDVDFDGTTLFVTPRPRLGMSIQDTEEGKGVKVLEVEPESNAAKAGILKDDIITHFDDKQVNGAEDVPRLLREKKDASSYRLQVLRNGKSQNIEVKIPKRVRTIDI